MPIGGTTAAVNRKQRGGHSPGGAETALLLRQTIRASHVCFKSRNEPRFAAIATGLPAAQLAAAVSNFHHYAAVGAPARDRIRGWMYCPNCSMPERKSSKDSMTPCNPGMPAISSSSAAMVA